VPQRKVAAFSQCAQARPISGIGVVFPTSGFGFVVIKPFLWELQIFDEFFRNPRSGGDSILNKIQGLPLV
jgi:hypothetical protein